MAIQTGDKLPEAKFRVMTAEGPQVKTTDDIFKGKKVALFAVPGAYTGTCHKMHLPSIFLNAYALKDKGVDSIAIVSVNDAFVMNAWKRDTDQRDEAVEVGKTYDGTVLKLLDFGAIVQVMPGKDGLLHISQIANERVNAVADYLKEGQQVRVKVLETDDRGRLKLSMKAAAAPEVQEAQPQA